MSWAVLRSNIYTLVDNNKDALAVQEVHNYPKLSFDGYPAVHISPGDNENDYLTQTENQREYVFKVRVFYPVKMGGTSTEMQTTMGALESVIDSMVDLFDDEDVKSGANKTLDNNMPADTTFIQVFATPSAWGLTEDEELMFADLTVRIRVSVELN